MASPWKFLARLMPPRRQKGQAHQQVEDVNPDKPGVASAANLLIEGSQNSANQPTAESTLPLDLTDRPFALGGAPGQFNGGDQNTVGQESSEVNEVSPPVLSGTGAPFTHSEPGVEETSKVASAKRKARHRIVQRVVASSTTSAAVLAVSDDVTRLDDEIRALRGQLVSKLRLQNAQLKKMLERFER